MTGKRDEIKDEEAAKDRYTTYAKYDRHSSRIVLMDIPDWLSHNDKIEVEITLLERQEIGCYDEDGTVFKACNKCGMMPGAPACEDRLREEKRFKARVPRPGKTVKRTENFNSRGGRWN